MGCVNRNSKEFQEILKFQPDVFLAEIEYQRKYNSTEAKLNTKDEFATVEVVEKSRKNNPKQAQPILYTNEAEWDYDEKNDTHDVVDNKTLHSLINSPKATINDAETQRRFNIVKQVIGETEAYRDYFEQNRTVRPASIIERKIEDRESRSRGFEYDDFHRPGDISDATNLITEAMKDENKLAAMNAMARLSEKLNIPFEIVSEEAARKKFGDSTIPNGYYHNGKVYLVDGLYDENTVFHEFAHPIFKSMSLSNPELFKALYNELKQTPFGQEIINAVKANEEYEEGSPLFMEEALVRSLENANAAASKDVTTFFGKLYLAIKQFLRNIFGKEVGRKLDVSKLSSETTLKEFLKMIQEADTVFMDTDFLNADDVVMLQKKYEAHVEAMQQDAAAVTQKVINEFYEIVARQLGNFQKENDAFVTISEGLANDEKTGVLQQMRLIMQELSTKSNKAVESLESLDNRLPRDAAMFKEKLHSFVSAIALGDEMFKIFSKKADILAAGDITDYELDQIHALDNYATSWANWLQKVKAEYTTHSYTGKNPVGDLMAELERSINAAKKKIDTLKVDSVIDALYNHLTEMYTPIKADYLDEMTRQKNAGNIAEYSRIHEEYYGLTPEERADFNRLKNQKTPTKDEQKRKDFLNYKSLTGHDVSKEQLRATASNQIGDAGYLNGLFDGYLNNQDKVVSGFGSYVQKTFNTIEGNVNSRQAELLHGLQPLLKAAGYDDKLTGEGKLGKDIAQRNTTFKKTEDGIESFEEYQFVSNFINHELPHQQLRDAVMTAKKEYTLDPSTTNWDAIYDAQEKLEDFERDYMNRDYVDEYYKLYDVFRTPTGKLARKAMDRIFENMRVVSDNNITDPTDFSAAAEMQKLWREYQQLHSGYDEEGNDKTGDDKAISDLLKQFRIDSSEFWEWEERPNAFQEALDSYKQKLEDAKLSVGSDAYKDAVNKWIEHNTTISIDESYYEHRKALMEERTELLKHVIAYNTSIIDVAPLQNQIYEILKKTKDSNGQFDGRNLTQDEQAQITDLNEQITNARKNYIGFSGITPNESERFNDIRDYYDYYGTFKTDEDAEFHDYIIEALKEKLINFGVGPSDMERIKEIETELSLMGDSSTTNSYIDYFQELVFNNDDTRKLLVEYAEQKLGGLDLNGDDVLEEAHINDMLNDQDFVNSIMSLNDDFRNWFLNNHYETLKKVFDKQGNLIDERMVYKKSAAWQFTAPGNKQYYKTKDLNDSTGAPVGIVELNGKPRIPNMSYYSRKVKEEYQNTAVLRDTIDGNGNLVLANMDNRGQWLPKTMEEGAKDDTFINANYKSMFENNRPLFDLQLFLKNKHLDFQKGLDNSQKLYLSYPRFRKGALEGSAVGVGREGYLKRKKDRFLDTFRHTADDYELGVNNAINRKATDVTLTRPLQGKYDIDINDVSTNIIASMGDHMYSIETFKAMRKVNSFANLMQSAIKSLTMNPEISGFKKSMLNHELINTTEEYANNTNRMKQINAIIEKNFQGVHLKGMDNKALFVAAKGVSKLSRMMSFSSFATDPVKSLTNYLGGKSMVYKKGLAGTVFGSEDYGLNDLRKAQIPATLAIGKIIKSQYSNKEKDVQLQLLDALGAIPDNVKKDVNDRGSKTFMQSVTNGGVFYFDRRFLNESVPVHQFYAILNRNSFMLDGKKTPLNEAVELRDGKLHTKDGVPEEFSITYNDAGEIQLGTAIQKIINKHQTLMIKNMGIGNEFTQPEYQRYLLGRVVFFMMKFITGMTMDRYGFKIRKNAATGKYQMKRRINLGSQRAEIGTYIGMIDTIRQVISTKGVNKLSKQNYLSLIGLASAIGMHVIWKLTSTGALVFNDDDDEVVSPFSYSLDDEHIYKKLKHFTTTGLPELPFVDKQYTAKNAMPFDADDWIKLQALRLALRVDKEETTFSPLGVGNNKGMLATGMDLLMLQSPLQSGGAQNAFSDIASNLLADEADTYDKKAGPYVWQQQGQNKNWNLVFKMFGLTGKLVDPAFAIEQENKTIFK